MNCTFCGAARPLADGSCSNCGQPSNLLEVITGWIEEQGSARVYAVPVRLTEFSVDHITLRPITPGEGYEATEVQYLLCRAPTETKPG